jgi:pyruvate/2-oxoglutarate dehydrogenase complex dihydrolipoamide dehydrogenase (E3) component
VIGAGSGGLSVAAGAVQMGADVVLIEKGKMGGDCLNYGCVPSKSLLAAGHAAQNIRESGRYGVNGHAPDIDFATVNAHVHGVIDAIAPNDSIARFEGLGVHVIQSAARFISPSELEAGTIRIQAKRFVIATGSSPVLPPVPGIDQVTAYTNETIFELSEVPAHLIIIGGGPIGLEMAQAHSRLGSRVTVLEGLTILSKDDPDAVDVVRRQLLGEGVVLHENTKVTAVAPAGNGVDVSIDSGDDGPRLISGSHLLVAAGRWANVGELNLEAAGVTYSAKGIDVDARLRTTNKHIFAIGDVAGSYQFTHIAGYHAGIVIRNALFRLPAKVDYKALPWVTYSDPELAQVGMLEKTARERYGDEVVKVLRWPFAENDRAQTERTTDGFIKVVTGRRGKVLGATIVGKHAGELLLPWVLSISQGLKISAMASLIAPYPTLGEVSKRVAGSYYTDSLFSARTRAIVRFLLRFG